MITPVLYNDSYELFCRTILNEEEEKDQEFTKHPTLIFLHGSVPIGFMTYQVRTDYFWLIHFAVDSRYRGDFIREILTFLRVVPKTHGFKHFVTTVRKHKRKLNAIIKRHYKVKPYLIDEEFYHYNIFVGE